MCALIDPQTRKSQIWGHRAQCCMTLRRVSLRLCLGSEAGISLETTFSANISISKDLVIVGLSERGMEIRETLLYKKNLFMAIAVSIIFSKNGRRGKEKKGRNGEREKGRGGQGEKERSGGREEEKRRSIQSQ